MQNDEQEEILDQAREFFRENKYGPAESLLNQLILRNFKSAELFHMLGVIYYDQGKFNKAIRSFRRALEIDASHTDSSVGLSIILNDLGRYDEGRQVFQEARSLLNDQSAINDENVNEQLSVKHQELGELYSRLRRHEEALDQFRTALELSTRRAEITMKIVGALRGIGNEVTAIRELKELIREFPDFIPARVILGKIYYETGQAAEAQSAWEAVLAKDPQHAEAAHLLRQIGSVDYTRDSELVL